MSMDFVQNQSIPNDPIRHFIWRVAVALRGAAPSRRRWSIWRHAGEQAPPDPMLDLERSFAIVRSLVLTQNVDDNRLRTQVENIKQNWNFASVSADLNKGWNELYEVKRLSVFLLSGDALYNETLMRLQDCEDCHAPHCKMLTDTFNTMKDQLYQRAASTAEDPNPPKVLRPEANALLRPLLLEILEEVERTERKKYTTRKVTTEAAKRLVSAWVITFLLFVCPYGYAIYWHLNLQAWTGLVPWTVLSSGLMGALFSRLIYLQTNSRGLSLEQVEDAKRLSSILLRGSVGMCGALIIFLFMQSGIMPNTVLLPVFEKIDLMTISSGTLGLLLPTPALALLVIWSFIAGFSQHFVRDILSAAEHKLFDAVTP